MDDNAGALYISDGTVRPVETGEFPDITRNRVVYEVIRIIDGVPLFLEDHFERMENSLSATGGALSIPQIELKAAIRSLLAANSCGCCNVKLTVYEESGVQKYIAYISKSYYPGMEEISKGVSVGLLRLERENPNAKVLNQTYKEVVAESLRNSGFFEVLLVNQENMITEGSKSNVFFYREGRIFTAPGSEVLKGITRKYVFKACKAAGFEVIEKLSNIEDLNRTEGLFLSGTSIKVLPVSQVDGHIFASAAHPAIAAVRDEFEGLLRKYIVENVNIW